MLTRKRVTSSNTKPEVVLRRRGRHLEILYDVITLPKMAWFWRNLPVWWRITRRLLWYGRSRNRRKNSNMADVCFSKPKVFTSRNWDMSTKFSLQIDFDPWKSDIIKYETGSSIEAPLPPSWNCTRPYYFAAGAQLGRNLVAWSGIARRLLWHGRSSNQNKNSSMTDVCFSKPEIVITQMWIEL